MYDNYYVFNHTTDRVSGYRPGAVSNGEIQGEKQISSDMVAWVTLFDTNIDYPVMQGDDNVRYLNTDPFGDYSLAGSIFLDCRNSSDFSDDYSLIYGHHMEYGRMFGALDEYLDEDYLNKHKRGELLIGYRGEEKHELEVFAVCKASAQDEEIFDPGKGDVREFIKTHAEVFLGESEERIVALSTCSEENASSRVIVFCYLKD